MGSQKRIRNSWHLGLSVCLVTTITFLVPLGLLAAPKDFQIWKKTNPPMDPPAPVRVHIKNAKLAEHSEEETEKLFELLNVFKATPGTKLVVEATFSEMWWEHAEGESQTISWDGGMALFRAADEFAFLSSIGFTKDDIMDYKGRMAFLPLRAETKHKEPYAVVYLYGPELDIDELVAMMLHNIDLYIQERGYTALPRMRFGIDSDGSLAEFPVGVLDELEKRVDEANRIEKKRVVISHPRGGTEAARELAAHLEALDLENPEENIYLESDGPPGTLLVDVDYIGSIPAVSVTPEGESDSSSPRQFSLEGGVGFDISNGWSDRFEEDDVVLEYFPHLSVRLWWKDRFAGVCEVQVPGGWASNEEGGFGWSRLGVLARLSEVSERLCASAALTDYKWQERRPVPRNSEELFVTEKSGWDVGLLWNLVEKKLNSDGSRRGAVDLGVHVERSTQKNIVEADGDHPEDEGDWTLRFSVDMMFR